MITTVPTKIAVAAAGLVLAGAAAAAAIGSPPDASDQGRATAEERTGFPVPVAAADAPGDDDAVVGEDEGEAEEPAAGAPERDAPHVDEDDEGGGPVDNHGAAVSAVAKDTTLTGREHGQAVAEVARSDAGKPPHGEDDDTEDADVQDHGTP